MIARWRWNDPVEIFPRSPMDYNTRAPALSGRPMYSDETKCKGVILSWCEHAASTPLQCKLCTCVLDACTRYLTVKSSSNNLAVRVISREGCCMQSSVLFANLYFVSVRFSKRGLRPPHDKQISSLGGVNCTPLWPLLKPCRKNNPMHTNSK